MERLALDTTFLIDLQRERRGDGDADAAHTFLRANPNTELFLPSVALGEFLEGFADPASETARALVNSLIVLEVTVAVAERYAVTTRNLRTQGRLIGANDLWIACTALSAHLPIVTRNSEHFSRIRGLEVVDYLKA